MHEREFDHAQTGPDAAILDGDLAPGRGNRAAQLVAPTRPLRSGLLQRKARDNNGVAEGAEQTVASASSGSGDPLPEPIMRKFESSLGTDLSSVRVHTSTASQTAASSVGARAYTVGHDIHFGAGQYDPMTAPGQHLLAHEVAHTVQQRGISPVRQSKLEVSTPADAAEIEADRAADAMVQGQPAHVGSAAGVIARRKDLTEAAERGEAEMDEVVRMPQVATTHVTNVGDKASAATLLNIIRSHDADIITGIREKQIDEGVQTANTACEDLLADYLESAEGHTVQISTFQGLFGQYMKDYARLNTMSKSFDGMDLNTVHSDEAAAKHGADQAKEIFKGEDAQKETARIKQDPAIQTRLDMLKDLKQEMTEFGKQVVEKSNDVAAALSTLSNRQRAFLAEANAVTSPEAQKQLQAQKARAQNDYSAAAGRVIKDALMGALTAAPGGPGAAAAGAGKAAASSVWSNVISKEIDKALENANIQVGSFPDNSAEANKLAAEKATWQRVQAAASAIVTQKNIVSNKATGLGTQFRLYQTKRDLYEKNMILLGQDMDKKAKTGPAPKLKDICDPNAKPVPPPKSKGPRYETVMQFLAEADRFTAQAEILKEQGEKELTVTADSNNYASQAHAKLVKATVSADRPNFYYTVNKLPVTRADGSTFIRLTPLRNSFTLHNALNPSQSLDGSPNEDARYGSAEGNTGFGANYAIDAALKQVDAAKSKIDSYRKSLASAVGL